MALLWVEQPFYAHRPGHQARLQGRSDPAQAFGGGADFVMLGGMLAGHDECAGDVVEQDGQQYKCFYGMSSRTLKELTKRTTFVRVGMQTNEVFGEN